jgi:hypothetical protein
MLELIVLGEIPGTGWQLNFVGMVIFAMLGVIIIRSLRSYHRFHKFTNGFGQVATYFVLMNKKTSKKRA